MTAAQRANTFPACVQPIFQFATSNNFAFHSAPFFTRTNFYSDFFTWLNFSPSPISHSNLIFTESNFSLSSFFTQNEISLSPIFHSVHFSLRMIFHLTFSLIPSFHSVHFLLGLTFTWPNFSAWLKLSLNLIFHSVHVSPRLILHLTWLFHSFYFHSD